MTDDFLADEMRQAIRATGRKPLIVCGAGVSASVTKGEAPCWSALVASGITRAAELDMTEETQAWAADAAALAKTKGIPAAALIAIADEVTRRLGGAANKEFAAWLEAAVGQLKAVDDTLLRAIIALDCPLATTNYDGLLAAAAGGHDVCWSDATGTAALLRGTRGGVLHLHGRWRDAAKVVLGTKSYDAHASDAHRSALQEFATLDRPTIFVGCSKDGLNDPDFARLGGWLTKWTAVAPRRYWLVRKSEVVPPNFDQRLFPVVYGETHAELAPYLDSLAPPKATAFPPNPAMLGRAAERARVVAAMLAGKPIVIPGGPGMGKTTLAVAAAHDARVIGRFGAARHFVALDAAADGEAVTRALAIALGLSATGAAAAIRAAIAGHCASAPVLAILDNAETPHDKDAAGTRAALAGLAALPGLALAVTVRGEVPRFALGTREVLDNIAPLDEADARALFLRNATQIKANDPDLPKLAAALEGHPLSLELIGKVAEGEATVAPVLRQWQRHRAGLLQEGAGDSRLTSVRASLRLSLNSPRMTEAARRLVGLIALLPAGLRRPDAGGFLAADGDAAAGVLMKLRLVSATGERLTMLAPLREAARLECPAAEADFGRLWQAMAAALADADATLRGSAEKSHALAEREAGNLDAMLGEANMRKLPLGDLAKAGSRLALFHQFRGLAGAVSLTAIAERALAAGAHAQRAACIFSLSDIALARSDHDAARAGFEEALPLYRRVGGVQGEANCIMSLGDIALRRSDHVAARAGFEEALLLYRRVGNVLGEANCIASLGDIALRRSDHVAARAGFEEALLLYRRVGGVQGEANCTFSLGDIALRRSDHDAARARFEDALPLYRRVGDVHGEANCTFSLGGIALARSDHDAARASFEEALLLYRRVGAVLGEANCIRSLGDIALARSDHDAARAGFEEALLLYRRVADVQGEANCITRLGDIAMARSDHDAARARFEEALLLYRRVGDVQGEANCIRSLGGIAEKEGRLDEAREHWHKALALYERIPEPYSIGATHHRLARLAPDSQERRRHRDAARAAWASIGREDLIAEYLGDEG